MEIISQDVRAIRGVDISSDHHLLPAEIRLKLSAQKRTEAKRKKIQYWKTKRPKYSEEISVVTPEQIQCITTTECKWTLTVHGNKV